MTRGELLAFLRRYRLAVEASVAPDGAPQAAVVGIAVSDELELIFDTLASTRKYANLRADPRVALVVGWGTTKRRRKSTASHNSPKVKRSNEPEAAISRFIRTAASVSPGRASRTSW